jgi:hypothetical protein
MVGQHRMPLLAGIRGIATHGQTAAEIRSPLAFPRKRMVPQSGVSLHTVKPSARS